jgi:hypothetical protein
MKSDCKRGLIPSEASRDRLSALVAPIAFALLYDTLCALAAIHRQ